MRYLKSRGVKKFVWLAREKDNNAAALQTVVEGLIAADFESDTYRSKKENNKNIESVGLAGFQGNDLAAALERGKRCSANPRTGRAR